MNFRLLVSCLKMWTIAWGYLSAWCSIIWSTAEKLMWCVQVYVIYCNSFSLGFQLLWMKPENLECNLKLLLGCQELKALAYIIKKAIFLRFPFRFLIWPLTSISQNINGFWEQANMNFHICYYLFPMGRKKCFISKFQFCLMITHST